MTEEIANVVSVQVPPDAAPGDVLSFVVNGQELELTLPQGSAPGDVLEIQVGISQQEDVADSSVTTVPLLGNNKTLALRTVLPGIDKNDDTADGGCDGTYAMPWPAGLEMVRYLDEKMSQQGDLDKTKTPTLDKLTESSQRVLELGSGLGLVGLCFAALYKSEKPTTVVLTDCSSAQPLLKHNVDQNQPLFAPKVSVQTQALEWEEETTQQLQPFDLLLGSDLMYNVSCIPDLAKTIQRYIHPTRGRIILSVRWRKPDLERSFFELLKDFDWTILSGDCPLSWRDYGDPSNDESNCYFCQTMVSVRGKPMSLADISESDLEQMTREESQAWERAQIQIYMGARKTSVTIRET